MLVVGVAILIRTIPQMGRQHLAQFRPGWASLVEFWKRVVELRVGVAATVLILLHRIFSYNLPTYHWLAYLLVGDMLVGLIQVGV